jgi:uncharacterized membrane protein
MKKAAKARWREKTKVTIASLLINMIVVMIVVLSSAFGNDLAGYGNEIVEL